MKKFLPAFLILVIGFSVLNMNILQVEAGIADFFYDGDGVVNPTSSYQRYRRSEYDANSPYFQWWYYTIKDLANNRYFAFDYSISDCATDLTNEGAYIMFSMVDKTTNSKFHKYERFPLNSFENSNYFDVQINFNNTIDFEIDVINDNTYHVRGVMNNPERVWYADGCAPDLYIAWDLYIYRIFGWYGQQDAESSLKSFGVISWDTYAHDAEVEGNITIGNTFYTISRNSNYRAYCDENWGENFPRGDPAIEYPWGWYYAGQPNSNPSQDISIIAGIGRHDTGFPMGTCLGKYADVRLTSSTHIGYRQNEIWSEGYSLMETCTDGDIWEFSVTEGDWINYTDGYGSALIPLYQKVYLESDHYIISMEFFSSPEDYNRLLFPHEYYVFSDFEGLGVDCHVRAEYWWVTYAWWDIFHLNPIWHMNVLYDFWTDDAGLEYGYQVE